MQKLERIRTISLDELRVRSAQKLAALAERRGWVPFSKLPPARELLAMLEPSLCGGRELRSARELLDHFRERTPPAFFSGLAMRNESIREIKERWPRPARETIERGNDITAGRFHLLGYHDLTFGDPVGWHFEPVSGKQAPLVHWSKLDYLNAELVGDHKIIWELNRHQYFTTLGRAYWLTGDEQYTETFIAHLSSWMDQNPPKLGINWVSSLEIAFRSISWIWSFYFFKDSPLFDPLVFMRALGFLYLNARHLETYLSTYFSPNTHLTGEALGLFYLGLLLPEFRDSARWRQTGSRILLEQLPVHVRPDGVYFEQASYYHRYTTDIYIHFLILSRANGGTVSTEVDHKLKALLDHLMYITRPDGSTPFFGDDDGGRLVTLDDRQANDFRSVLSTGAVLFKRPDYNFVAGGPAEETLWLLGPAGLQELDRIGATEPARQSVAFNSGGYYVMRDDWSNKANYLLFDCGPHGHANCGHSHADALSFELAANGRTMLVDPGTFTYTGSRELREWFRSTAAHNCLTINQRSSSVTAGPFSWKTIARTEQLAWISRERFDYVAGAHDGYAHGQPPASHERSIVFLKHDYWIVRDRLKSRGEADVDVWFHFDSTADPQIETLVEPRALLAGGSEDGLDVVAFAANGRWRREEGWVSKCYAQREPAGVFVFSVLLSGSGEVISFLLPRTASLRWRVRQTEATGGLAFEITKENRVDLVMIRQGEVVETVLQRTDEQTGTVKISSDFDCLWARFSRANGAVLEELLLLGGTRLALEGRRPLLKMDRRIDYLFASGTGDRFHVETNEGVLNLPAVQDLKAAFLRPAFTAESLQNI